MGRHTPSPFCRLDKIRLDNKQLGVIGQKFPTGVVHPNGLGYSQAKDRTEQKIERKGDKMARGWIEESCGKNHYWKR